MATQRREGSRVRSTAAAFGLAVFGYVVASLAVAPVRAIEPGAMRADRAASLAADVAALVSNFIGFALAGGAYLAYTRRGWEYVDLRAPTRREWAIALAATVGSIGYLYAFGIVARLLDLPQAPNDIVNVIGDDTTLLLAVVIIVFVVNAPAEEFLFRNVVQKRLYDAFSKPGAVVVASLVFALVHVPVYLASGYGATAAAVSIAAIFGATLVFATAYAATDNLVVPIVAHAGFNAVQFGTLYLQLEYGGGEPAALLALLAI